MLPGSVAELSCFRLSFGNWEILYWVKICWLTKPLWNPQMILTGALRELMEGVFNSKSHDSTLIFAIAILQIHLFQLLLPLMCVRFSTNLTISLCQQLLWFCLSAWSAYKKPFFGTSNWITYLCQRMRGVKSKGGGLASCINLSGSKSNKTVFCYAASAIECVGVMCHPRSL